MAYQRFGDDSDLYIWASIDSLNIWIANSNPKTKTVKLSDEGFTELKFDSDNLDEATTLFRSLYNHLLSNGSIVEINKKRKELKIRKAKNNDRIC
jgi:hypothetical protein